MAIKIEAFFKFFVKNENNYNNPFSNSYNYPNPFPYIATKEEIAQNKQFLLLSPCFQLYSVIVLSFKGSFHFFGVSFQSSLLQSCWETVNPFPHTAFLQQTTLNVFCQKIENLHNWMDNLWKKVENIVAKGEIARFVKFLLLSLCFQKAVCYRRVRKQLYEGKG